MLYQLLIVAYTLIAFTSANDDKAISIQRLLSGTDESKNGAHPGGKAGDKRYGWDKSKGSNKYDKSKSSDKGYDKKSESGSRNYNWDKSESADKYRGDYGYGGNKGYNRHYNDRYDNKGWGKYDKSYESKGNDYYKDSHFSRDRWH
eukprot:82298_1